MLLVWNCLTVIKVGPSKSTLVSFFFPIRLQYHLMNEPISHVFRSNLFSSGSLYVVASALAQLFSGSGRSFGGMDQYGFGVFGTCRLLGKGRNQVVVYLSLEGVHYQCLLNLRYDVHLVLECHQSAVQIGGQSFVLKSQKEHPLCQMFAKLKMTKFKAVWKPRHQSHALSSCFNLI
ncbi:hypothetical protein Tco_0651929 [Tanacetum coccineum]|uniref:Uncharacterized protein n=1 Tax=Tanacetum coccineum TaxID=301880 RepID=A0ABQ4WWS2_9ASTR